MAGSFQQVQPDDDRILISRLEGLKLLADQLAEPVVIFDPTLQLVYSNDRAEAIASSCPLLERTEHESSAPTPAITQDSCVTCPAKSLLSADPSQSMFEKGKTVPHSQNASCPFPTSFSIQGKSEASTCVVMMGKTPEESLVHKTDLENLFPPKSTHASTENRVDHSLVGRSALMQQLVDMIGLVSASDSTVLIEGESGTGKEVVARTIHQLSARRDRPFVVVECSSLPETLLESELFGHVRGAFTGAVADRKGLFEEAEGGTIFLDEIADTVPTFQAKLLRALQEGEIKPVGSNRSAKVNVRVISASNKHLLSLVRDGAFRSDLYYRLAVLPLMVPPLRERREDIPLLVHHFLEQSCRKNRKTGLSIAAKTMEALMHHHWPGNVRELENVIERAVVIAHSSSLTIQDIFGLGGEPAESVDLATVSKAARQSAEKQEILKALQETQGDKTRAARLLKISRASLYNKLKAYQL